MMYDVSQLLSHVGCSLSFTHSFIAFMAHESNLYLLSLSNTLSLYPKATAKLPPGAQSPGCVYMKTEQRQV